MELLEGLGFGSFLAQNQVAVSGSMTTCGIISAQYSGRIAFGDGTVDIAPRWDPTSWGLWLSGGWLLGWLIGWLIGWLVGWLAGWLADWLVSWPVGWLVGIPAGYMQAGAICFASITSLRTRRAWPATQDLCLRTALKFDRSRRPGLCKLRSWICWILFGRTIVVANKTFRLVWASPLKK